MLLPDKKKNYSNLNMDDITDADYKHAKTVKKDFNRKYLGKHYDLYVQSITLLLTDVFESFCRKCCKIFELDLDQYLSAPGLAWQACLENAKIELELLNNIDTLMIIEKRIRG